MWETRIWDGPEVPSWHPAASPRLLAFAADPIVRWNRVSVTGPSGRNGRVLPHRKRQDAASTWCPLPHNGCAMPADPAIQATLSPRIFIHRSYRILPFSLGTPRIKDVECLAA